MNGLSLLGAALALLPLLPAPTRSQDPSTAGTGEGFQLTLDQARRLAIETNLELEIAELGVDIARFGARGSWGAFDPVLSLSARYEDSETQLSNPFFAGIPVLEEQRLVLDGNLAVPVTTGGQFNFGYRSERSETNSPNSLEPELTADALSLGFTQPLLRGAWQRVATAEQRRLNFQAQREEELLRQRRADLLLDVENAYWDLVAALDQREVRVQAVALFERQAEEEAERLRVGVGTEVDLLQAETNLALERERLLLAEADVEGRRDTLKALVLRRSASRSASAPRGGISAGEDGGWREFLSQWNAPLLPATALPEPESQTLASSWEQSLAEAYERRPELAAQRLEIEARRARLERARSQSEAGLDLTVDARSAAFDASSSEALEKTVTFESPTYGLGLAFDLPLGNRTARNDERAARSELRAALLELERIERTLLTEVRAGVRDLEYRREAVAAARKSRELAQRQLESEEVRYREGLSTTFQLLQFQQDLANALSNERAALANYAKARASLARAEGRIGGASFP